MTENLPKGTDLSNLSAQAGDQTLSTRVSDLSTFGQKGLRSLVLQLPGVGQEVAFERPGGEARLRVGVVREASLAGACGLLALLGFLVSLLAPRTGLLTGSAVVLCGLSVVTGAGLLAGTTAAAPLFNAVALGLLVGAPVLLLVGLGRVLEGEPLARLRRAARAAREDGRRGAPASSGTRRLVLLLPFALALVPSAAQAQEAPERPRVYIPYDPADGAEPARSADRVFVPLEVYERLAARAFPEAGPAGPGPVVPHVVAEARYEGQLADRLTLQATVQVGILAEGWERVPLGLRGAGLASAQVAGSRDGAKVRAASSGGFELVAKGPGTYRVTLDLVVPKDARGYTLQTVPCLAATLSVRRPAGGERLVVGGARAQVERPASDGEGVVVDASLGDAPSVTLALRSGEVLSAGASEASAQTRTVAWVRRGRVEVSSWTTFTISGAGREGFVFALPKGFEVTQVEAPGLRTWEASEGRLRVELRRATGRTALVQVRGEQRLPAGATSFDCPQVEAQGVSRESGIIGVCVEDGLRVRPAQSVRLRQMGGAGLAVQAKQLGAGAVERAYGFARRPSPLRLELVSERVEVKAASEVRATVLADLYVVEAEVAYDVSRGKLYELAVLAPAGLDLVETPSGLDVREVAVDAVAGDAKRYRLGLASGLSGSGRLQLTFARRLTFDDRATVPFPDVRPLGVSRETTNVAVAVGPGLVVRVPEDPAGLAAQDIRPLTRRLGTPAGGARWRLAYSRANGRVAGLARGEVQVTRPRALVRGSWVLHARVERDVVRYTLRALYEIENAGVQRFHLLLPASAGERIEVESQNQREVTSVLVEDGARRRFTVELQSPAEVFYDLALSWEEVLEDGAPFALPNVGIAGVSRQVKGYVLVEKAPEVVDVLEEASHEGSVRAGARAADAPALPPGRGARDFVLVYEVALGRDAGPWAVSCRLRKAAVELPPPARILWAHVESVLTPEGEARHRVRYRVHNLRLQFLQVELPPSAKVWSVFVDDAPMRLHRRGAASLVPLPNRSAADLSFDVELIYTTPPNSALGQGQTLSLVGPVVKTDRVEPERTFWTVYTPEGHDAGGFAGNVEPAAAERELAQVLEAEVQEMARLADLQQRSSGRKKAVAAESLQAQRRRIEGQLDACDYFLRGRGEGEAHKLAAKNGMVYRQLEAELKTRQREELENQRKQAEGQQLLAQDVVTVEGNTFERTQSGWATNKQVFKKGNRVQWSGTEQSEAPQRKKKDKAKQSTYTLVVPEGQELELKNAQVDRETQAAQQRRGANYGYYSQRQQRQMVQQEGPGFIPQTAAPAPGSGGADRGGGTTAGGGRSEGLLSIRVAWEPPGRAHHFSGAPEEAPQLSLRTTPRGAGQSLGRLGQALCLLVLLAGLGRLGVLRPRSGRAAQDAFVLLAGLALGGVALLHPAAAALAFLAGLWALKHGAWGAATAEARS
jgi:hypothetical protein